MQLFTCPFCGSRDEREFHFLGEAGKVRPDTSQSITDAEWARYVFEQSNPKGPSQEVWMHLPCREVFLMERDTVSMQVKSHMALRHDDPT